MGQQVVLEGGWIDQRWTSPPCTFCSHIIALVTSRMVPRTAGAAPEGPSRLMAVDRTPRPFRRSDVVMRVCHVG